MSETPTAMSAERVTVGVDGSPPSVNALRWAVDEARLRDADVEVVLAWQLPYAGLGPLPTPADVASVRHDAVELLDAILERAGLAHTLATCRHVREGQPAAVLLEAARAASLLVVGSCGHARLGAQVLGSVSGQCAHHTPCPLAVIRNHAPLPNDGGDVVVGVDGSDGSARALAWAMNEAACRDVSLVVVHAWSPPPAGGTVASYEPTAIRTRSRTLLDDLVARAAVVAAEKPRNLELVPVEDLVAPALIDRSRKAGLLVVGSRGRGGFARLLLGTVSYQCLHHAETNVVIVPATEA